RCRNRTAGRPLGAAPRPHDRAARARRRPRASAGRRRRRPSRSGVATGSRSTASRRRIVADSPPMNFARDVVDAAPRERRALIELDRDGHRREWSFGEVSDRSARLAGALEAQGVKQGDVVMTLIGNRPDWVLTMVACFRIGAVALACNEQLRAKDLRVRLDAADPTLIVADERDLTELSAARPACPVLTIPDQRLFEHDPAAAVELEPTDHALITFT